MILSLQSLIPLFNNAGIKNLDNFGDISSQLQLHYRNIIPMLYFACCTVYVLLSERSIWKWLSYVLIQLHQYDLGYPLLFCRLAYAILIVQFFWHKRDKASSLIGLLLLITKMHNAPLIILHYYLLHYIQYHVHRPYFTLGRSLFLFCMSESAFFSFGNSNSPASVDFSGGYIGLTEFNPLLTPLLIAFLFLGPRLLYQVFLAKRWRMSLQQVMVASTLRMVTACVIIGAHLFVPYGETIVAVYTPKLFVLTTECFVLIPMQIILYVLL